MIPRACGRVRGSMPACWEGWSDCCEPDPDTLIKHERHPWRCGQRRGNLDSKTLKQSDEVAAPSRCHSRCSECVFDDQVPANDPSENFAEGCVGIRVRRPGNRNQRRKLRVTKACKHAADTREDERQNNCGPCEVCRHRSSQNEYACADDRADSKCHQIDGSENASQAAFAFFACLAHQCFEWFRR